MFQTTSGDVSLVADDTSANFSYIFASVEAEPLPGEGVVLTAGSGSYISSMVIWVEEQLADPQFETICPIYKQCVSLLKENGFQTTGNAWDLKSNATDPCRGCAILLKNHVGIVLDYDREYVEFEERNFLGCGIYSRRRLPVDNNSIRGYLIK